MINNGNSSSNNKALIDVKEYMEYTGRSKRLAYEDLKTPGFPSVRIGKKLYVVRSAFDAWLEKKMQEPKTA